MKPNNNFKPIIFSTPMVQAILQGEKTQTRRIIKVKQGKKVEYDNSEMRKCFLIAGNGYIKALKCPYKVGDILWVRETWHPKRHSFPIGEHYEYKATAKEDGNPTDESWKPSIHMPKEACRIFLKLKSIRIQRLNDISESDAIAEGIKKIEGKVIGYPFGISFKYSNGINNYSTPIEAYMSLWEKINGKGSWAENPWVWVYDFKVIDTDFETI